MADPQLKSNRLARAATITALLALALVIVGTIGDPLIGRRVFHGASVIYGQAPWSEERSLDLDLGYGPIGDTVDSTMPNREQFGSRAREGEVALWNPYVAGGTPLGSTSQSGVLSPMNLPFVILPAWLSPAYAKLIEMSVAAGFTFLFLRRLGSGRVAALLAGAMFASTGFAIAWNNWQHPQVAALIAAVFWATERHLQLRRPSSLVPIAVTVALMFVGGFPAVAAYGLMLLVPYVGVRFVSDSIVAARRDRDGAEDAVGEVAGDAVGDGPASSSEVSPAPDPAPAPGETTPDGPAPAEPRLPSEQLRTTWWDATRGPLLTAIGAGAGVVLGLCLAAAVVLPFQAHLGNLDLGWRHQNPESHLPLSALATAIVPNALGAARDDLLIGSLNTVEALSFLGAITVLLVAVALLLRSPRRTTPGVRGFFAVALLVTAVLAYVGGPVLELAQHAPIMDANFVGRLRSVFGFEAAVLAGLGAQALIERRLPQRWWQWLIGGASVLVLVGFVVAAFQEVNDLAVLQGERGYVFDQARLPALCGLVGLALVAWLLVRRSGGAPTRDPVRSMVVAGLGILFAVEALALVVPRLPRIDRDDFYPDTATHDFLADHLEADRFVTTGQTMFPNSNSIYDLRSVTGHTHHQTTWAEMLITADPEVFSKTPTYSILGADPTLLSSPIFDRLSARYAVTSPGQAPPGAVTPPDASAADRVEIGPAGTSVTVPARPLRGVTVLLAERYQESGALLGLAVEVTADDGTTATGSRRIIHPTGPGPMTVAVLGEGLPSTGSMTITLRSQSDEVLAVQGTGDVPTLGFVEPIDDGLRLVHGGDALVYERTHALPRVRWASHARGTDDPGDRTALLARGLPDDTVLLSEEAPADDPDARPAEVEVIADDPEELVAQIDARDRGWLVVADAKQDGWVAELNGREVPLVDADHALVAVEVPPGHHELRISYRPEGRRLGFLISALSVLVLIGLVVLTWRQARRRPLT